MSQKKWNLKVTKVKDTPNGKWTGGYMFQTMLADYNTPFRGCPMGRADNEPDSVRDLVRRINDENFAKLSTADFIVQERADRS